MSVLAVVPTIMTAIYACSIGLVAALGVAHVVLRRLAVRGGRHEVRSTTGYRG